MGGSFSWCRDVSFSGIEILRSSFRYRDLLRFFIDLQFTGCRGPKKDAQADPRKRRYDLDAEQQNAESRYQRRDLDTKKET